MWFFLGQIRSTGSPKGSTKVLARSQQFPRGTEQAAKKGCAESSTKAPARFTHQTFAKLFQVSWRLWFWGQLRLGPPERFTRGVFGFLGPWAAKRFRGRFHQGSAKVAARLDHAPKSRQGSTKARPKFHQGSPSRKFDQGSTIPPGFHQVSPRSRPGSTRVWCFWFFEPFRFGLPKGSAEGFFTKVPTMPRQVHQCPTKVSPRCHQGSPGFVVWAGCQKVMRVPPRVHHGSTKVSLKLFYEGSTFVSQMAVVSERVLFGALCRFSNCSLHLCPNLVLASKLHEWLTCLTHTLPIRRGRPILSVLLGYFLGLFLLQLPPPACPAPLVCLFGVCGIYLI